MPATTDEMVTSLLTANRSRISTPALHDVAELDHSGAYLIQKRVFGQLWGSAPEDVRGYKISLVTEQDQRNFSTDQPACGRLSESHFIASPATIALTELFCPLAEPELVFHIDADLSPNACLEEILEKSHVAAGFEVPDSRYAGWYPVPGQLVTDLIADNSYAGKVIHAQPKVHAAAIDLTQVQCRLSIDGELFGTGMGSDVQGNPAMPIVWLSKAITERGDVIRKGSRIASGTFLYPPVAKPGLFVAEYSGVGTVSINFR